MNKPLVSVVVPVYNAGDKLETAVKYILGQSYANIEVLLVDNGSDDGSYDVCKQFAADDSRVKCLYESSPGSGPARNKGIENASGKYIFFPDADDKIELNLIETVTAKLEETESDIAVFGFKRVLGGSEEIIHKLGGEVVGGDIVRREYHKYYGFNDPGGIQGAPWNKMFRLDIIKENNIKYPPLRRHQDDVFIMRYVDVCRRVVFINQILYTYYANDRKRLFDKFPEDYFEIVSQCSAYRCEYILKWNPANEKIVDMVCESFVSAACQALIVSFNPKFGYTAGQRYSAMKDISRRVIEELPKPDYSSNSILFSLMKSKRYLMLYIAAFLALKKHYGR